MIKPQLNNKGFGILGVLAIIVVLCAVGGAGVYVYRHNHKAKTAVTTSSYKTTTSKSSPASTSTQQNYLIVKEWGVRVPMPRSVNVSDIYYITSTDTQNGSSPTAILASHKLNSLTPDCIPPSGQSPFGSIERITPASYQQALGDSQDTGVTGGTLLGSYYYVWQAPRANCYSSENSNSQFITGFDKLTDDNTELVDNFPTDMNTILKSIEVIPQS